MGEHTAIWLTAGLVVIALVQALILAWQAKISSSLRSIEASRRAEEGPVVGWARLRDDDTDGENQMARGKIYQLAVWNQGARDQLVWDAQVRVIGSDADGQYPAYLGAHASNKLLHSTWRIPAKSADRVQFLMDASLDEVERAEQGWMFLRFRTPDGPDYILLSSPGGEAPPRDDVLVGWVPRLKGGS